MGHQISFLISQTSYLNLFWLHRLLSPVYNHSSLICCDFVVVQLMVQSINACSMSIVCIAPSLGAKRAYFISTEGWWIMHLYSEQRVPYGNNINICAAEVLVHKKSVLSYSLARTLLQSLLILDASTVPSGHGPFFS